MISALLLASLAYGQDAERGQLPLDLERFKPAMDTFGYAVTESSTTLGHLQVGVGMWGNYSDDSLVLMRANPDNSFLAERVIGPGPDFPDGLLNQRSVVNFQTGLGIGNIFSLTADMPVVVWQEGFEPSANRFGDSTLDLVASGLGDLRLAPKFVIADIHQGYPIGLAIVAPVSIPTGDTRSFIGEGDVTATPMAVIEAADGSIRDREYLIRAAINVGGRIKSTDVFRDTEFGSEFIYRAALAAKPAPALEFGADFQGSTSGPRIAQNPIEIMPYLKLIPVDFAAITAGAGFGLADGAGAPDIRAFAGATLAPRFDPLSLDRDKDGIPNKYDQCINIPEDLDGWEDEDGCPEDDNDQDGILDASDRCPDNPEDFDEFQDADGCPDDDNDQDGVLDTSDRCPLIPEDFDGFEDLDGCPDQDNDRDGILDAQDSCPNAAETFNGFDDTDGCPDEKPFVDTDGDGYTDDIDRCPFDPEDFDNFEDEDGCPDTDNDQDGIFDTVDNCPFDPETANGYLDEDGCPDEAPSRVVIEKTKINILEKVFFEVNKAVIKSDSFDLLNEVARVIVENPQLTVIRIEGHTDSDGSEAYNLRLSQSRAESVVNFLVEAGVDRARLDPVGFGETRPIDTNRTSEGKENNRRVEFVIVEQE